MNASLGDLQDLPEFALVKSLIRNPPTWDNFFAAANEAAHRSPDAFVGNPIVEHQINSLTKMGVSYFYFYPTEEDREEFFSDLLPLQQTLHEIFPRDHKKFNIATVFLNVLAEDVQAGPHADNTHNLYVQCHGTVEWTIHAADENYSELGTFQLGPGDGIFVKSGVYHSVRALGARAAVTFRLDVEDTDETS